METEKRILRREAIQAKTGLSIFQIDRKERAGEFPQRVQIGANSVGWVEAEIDAWIDALPRGALPPKPGPVKRHTRGKRASNNQPSAVAA